MDRTDLTGTLAIGTIGVVLIIAAVLLIKFLRKPGNRHPMAGTRERNIGEIEADAGKPERVRTDRPIS